MFLNNDLESNIALNYLLPTLSKHHFNIFLSLRVGKELPVEPLQHLAILEQTFIQNHLFPELSRQSYDGFLSFEQISQKYKATVTVLKDIKSQERLSVIQSFKPDLFVSIRFGLIFKGAILSIPPLGIINLHSAILPNYKGVMGTFRAILNGDHEIGSTLHYIDDNTIDTGRIIAINRLPVSKSKSVLWHVVHLYPQAIKQLDVILSKIETLQPIDVAFQSAGGHYYTFPAIEEFEKLSNMSFQFYDLDEFSGIIYHYYKVAPNWTKNILTENYLLPLQL